MSLILKAAWQQRLTWPRPCKRSRETGKKSEWLRLFIKFSRMRKMVHPTFKLKSYFFLNYISYVLFNNEAGKPSSWQQNLLISLAPTEHWSWWMEILLDIPYTQWKQFLSFIDRLNLKVSYTRLTVVPESLGALVLQQHY